MTVKRRRHRPIRAYSLYSAVHLHLTIYTIVLHFTDPPTDHAYMSISPTKPAGMQAECGVC